ncbi:monovalent cation/H(+) antiporter subunit G [Streptomyces sp. FXJ1.172]|uniref:monovalent cation/H(+) antiporter subunit G n=1 Tax=Streptomyces sp. FXJ1.172 TaxID=710705 RepID=UPI00082E541C|nr:monovalent cation/H(+) antiporter subunit G [Streptomyces sp. FXJ1.172]WEO99521.1 monovalent cation/H(+) antiporter subunit G [Streptomyces sp. FXJ1.172]
MTVRHVCALVLLVAGTGVLLLSALSLTALARPFARLHALTPATTAGVPLVALALAVETGPGRAAVKLLLIAVIVAFGGAVTAMAIGRATAQHEGLLREDSSQ